MPRRYKRGIIVGLLFSAGFVLSYTPHLLFGWHSRPKDVLQTKQIVLRSAQTVEDHLRRGLAMPTNTNELGLALGGAIPRDAWGSVLHYQYFAPTNFAIYAMSPYPESLIICYDSRLATNKLEVVPF